MPAINIMLRQRDAYLATDSAFLAPDRTLAAVGPRAVSMPHWPGVLALTGTVADVAACLVAFPLAFPDIDAFAEGGPALLKSLGRPCEAFAVGWSRARNMPRGIIVGITNEGEFGAADLPNPGTVWLPKASPLALRRCGAEFVPDRDLEAVEPLAFITDVLVAQRETTDSDDGADVGGPYTVFAKVTESHVMQWLGIGWADVIGAKIAPKMGDLRPSPHMAIELQPSAPEPANRNERRRRGRTNR